MTEYLLIVTAILLIVTLTNSAILLWLLIKPRRTAVNPIIEALKAEKPGVIERVRKKFSKPEDVKDDPGWSFAGFLRSL